MVDRVTDSWVLNRSASLEQQAVALRLLAALLTAWQFQYPLTEESFMELVVTWASDMGSARAAPAPHDPPPADELLLMQEERAVYSTGGVADGLPVVMVAVVLVG